MLLVGGLGVEDLENDLHVISWHWGIGGIAFLFFLGLGGGGLRFFFGSLSQ